ncbi:7,8-dihydropteroate synthase [Legionella rubrilucens]|uniref:Dihydropteroate synthase n=1 Tax=Legionella rubrilucens TaxID=458 RepID=A0A0W0XQB2_9GAMM|nr:dihydropteroate synthase [Legionella rubrilucens]KTD46708.1 7,8-dihydropteroate synthase [Legionella rubrilucens]
MNNSEFLNWLTHYARTYSTPVSAKPLIMGVLNITPDSFADGGRYMNPDAALQQALTMRDAGADLIDLGGESSQPGARAVSIQEQLDRVLPVIEKIRQESDICLSIDTTRAEVMRAAVAAGADLINDIKALSEEGALATAAELNVPVCLMHMKGIPETMQENPYYSKDVVDEINDFFIDRIERCIHAGIASQHLILDPGFGFGKSVQHNLWLTKHIQRFQQHGLPLLLGASRKSTLGAVLNKAVEERLIGSIAVAVFAGLQGVAIIRTHDVGETNQALSMIDAIVQAENE